MSAIPRNNIDASINPVSARGALALRTAIRSVVKSMSVVWNFWSYRSTMTQLELLDDHMLKDIGVTRGDVQSAATLPYTDDPTSQLRRLSMERRAADLVWTKNGEERQKMRALNPTPPICETYRSSDQRDADLR